MIFNWLKLHLIRPKNNQIRLNNEAKSLIFYMQSSYSGEHMKKLNLIFKSMKWKKIVKCKVHASDVNSLDINAHFLRVKTHSACSWLNMKNHPENVINRNVKYMRPHILGHSEHSSRTHISVTPFPVFFFFPLLWRQLDKTDIPEAI